MTNRLLLEAGFWRHQETWGGKRAQADITDPLAVGITDNNPQTLIPGYTQLIQNYRGRVGATDTASHNPNYRGNVAASYVTGSHSFKAGMDLNGATRWADTSSVVPYSYVVSTLAQQWRGIRHPGADHALPALRRMHGPARSPGQWWSGRRGHIHSALLSNASEEQGQRRGRHLRAGQVDDRSCDAQHGHPLRLVQFREPRVPPRTVHPHAEPQLRRARVRYDPLQGLHAQSRGGVGRLRRRKDGHQGQLREVRARAGARCRRTCQPAGLQRPAHVVSIVDRQRQGLGS